MNGLTLFYHFYTPLHFGSGTTLSYVDLPIERESHTQFPLMPSTGIKGVFRAFCEKVQSNNADTLFGKGDEEGSLIFIDGRLLLFPVKSAKGVFVWITCPMVLKRLLRDMEQLNIDLKDKMGDISFENDEQAIVADDAVLINNYLILEELSFSKKANNNMKWVETLDLPVNKKRVVILTDDMFTYFVKHSTEINARIRIDQNKGTVEEGALWYEELVPEESVFYSLVFERKDNGLNTFKDLIAKNTEGIFQFGGDETLGRGFAKVILYESRR